jgi:glycosyltransferase involved in cell wall biosynthesis
MSFRIAVDAINLASDRRGMGRYVRQILREWSREPDLTIALLVRNDDGRAPLVSEFGCEALTIGQAKRSSFEAIWYPWNGMRFELPARSVVTMHDAFAFTQPARGWIARRREQTPIRVAAARADALATVSHWSAAELARELHVAPERFTVTGNVCDSFWQPSDVVPTAKPYVFFLAGPEPRKNAAMLFEAFSRAFPDERVSLIVGGHLSQADVERLERSSIAFSHSLPDDERLRALYSGALAVVVPSYAEGFGLPALEAMACGAPVLAADAGALPEACDGAAMLLPARDPAAWNRALLSIAHDPALRAELRAKSLARAARVDSGAPARITLSLLRRSP